MDETARDGVTVDADGIRGVVPTTVAGVWFVAAVVLGAVLRLWSLGHGFLSADESYSAVSGHLPLSQIWGHINANDPHPPLSYLLISPVAHLFTSNLAIRLPAAACSILAVAVMAWWQRDRGVGGLAATLLLALSPFALEYGREARMYGLVSLASVALAAAGDRWLGSGDRRWAFLAAGAAFVIAMSYSAGVIMPAALVLLAGWRRDRQAWTLRASAGAALGLWAALWLGHALRWSGKPSGYPPLSLAWVRETANSMVAPIPSNEWLVLTLLALGLVVVLRRSPRQRPLVLALFVAPVAALLVISLHNNVFLPKSLIMVVWAAPLLLGNLAGEAWELRPVAGAVVLAVLVLVVVPYVRPALNVDEGTGPMLTALARARQPGDAVAMDPGYLGHLLDWYVGMVPGRRLRPDGQTIPGAVVYRDEGHPPTGRVWLVRSPGRARPPSLPGANWCGPETPVGGGYTLRCLQVGAGR